MSDGPTIPDASEDDAAACAAIHAPYVTDTAISFASDPPPAPELARRITGRAGRCSPHGDVMVACGAG